MRPAPSRARRSQALLEFALVMPLFLLIVAGLTALSLVVLNQEVAASAARLGARTGLDALGPYAESLARHPVLSAIHPAAGENCYAGVCVTFRYATADCPPCSDWIPRARRANGTPYMRNPDTGDMYTETQLARLWGRLDIGTAASPPLRTTLVRLRAGWDWGILDGHQAMLRAALASAIDGARRSMGLAGATGARVTYHACLLPGRRSGLEPTLACPRGGSASVMVGEAVDNGPIAWTGSLSETSVRRGIAPRWLRVEIDIAQVSFLDGTPLEWTTSSTVRIDRFSAACPVPDTIAAQAVDPCGAPYPVAP